MSTSMKKILENTKQARDMALDGNYDHAGIYYEGVLQQLKKMLVTAPDPSQKSKYTLVGCGCDCLGDNFSSYLYFSRLITIFSHSQFLQQINKEYNEVKGIQRTLSEVAIGLLNKPMQNKIRLPTTSEPVPPHPAAWFQPDPDVWAPPNPYRDPDIWSPPVPLDTR